jgi:hypothetical protein
LTAALLLASACGAAPAYASSAQATVSGASAVSTVAWGAVPTAQSVASAPPCLSVPSSCGPFSASSLLGLTSVYFNVWNSGTVALVGLSYSVSLSSGTFTLTACSVPWGSLGSCSGAITTVLSSEPSGTYPVTVAVPVSPGAGVYLQMALSLLVTSVTVSTEVCSGGTACTDGTSARQIRAAVTTEA